MAKTFYFLLKEIRPRQWLKNLALFVSIFFTGQLFNIPLLLTTIFAFIIFCLASSSIYIFNDIQDLDKDRLHPFKRNRPLAAGKVTVSTASFVAMMMTVLALSGAYLISMPFFVITVLFYALQISYSLYLKNIILLDILTIAASFIIRVFAGEAATGFHLDIWLFLTVISASLFIAIGKRRSELTLLSGWPGSIPAKTRATLSQYSDRMLDIYISMFANSTWITYAFYTFLKSPPTIRKSIGDIFSQYNLDTYADRKWMMLTIPIAIYGIMRYLQLIYEKNQGESPEKVLLSDRPMMFTAIVMGLSLFTIIYILGK